MGIYIYSLRRTGVVNTRVAGWRVKVYRLAFLGRSRYDPWTGKEAAHNRRLMAAAENAWHGKPMPEYVYLGDKADGTPVHRWGGTSPLTYDTPQFKGLGPRIGFLCKIGGRWEVVAAYYNLVAYYTRDDGSRPVHYIWERVGGYISRRTVLAVALDYLRCHPDKIMRFEDENGIRVSITRTHATVEGFGVARRVPYTTAEDILAAWCDREKPKTAYDHLLDA